MMRPGNLLFGFKGRIDRRTWWLAAGATMFVMAALWTLMDVLTPHPALTADQTMSEVIAANSNAGETAGERYWYIGVLQLVCLFVLLAIGAKRCHDRGRSGWFQLLLLIPVLGWIWLLVELGFLPGTAESNRYGSPGYAGVGAADEPPRTGPA